MKLHPPAFSPVKPGEIQPTGWLKNQLVLQAHGISGNLDAFWPDIQDSQWFGGNSESWERAPYWLDGLIPLAYVLDDAKLKAKVNHYMDYILTHQHPDGWFGPKTMVASGNQLPQNRYDLWAQLLFTKVLVQYARASEDSRAMPALTQNLLCLDRHIDTAPLHNWGQFRWFEGLIAIYWLYEQSHEAWLLDLAIKLSAQGFDWTKYFMTPTGWPARNPTPKGRWSYMSHVVNNAMAPKAPALWWRISGDPQDRRIVNAMINQLQKYHGMDTGMFTGDECLAGLNPTHGTELCAVVEYAFSLETILSIFGDVAAGDLAERIIFNALPATFSPDMWSHQYDQQVNQIECSINENRIWNTNGPESNIFGVEPNYGCCTANLSQGWPKFVSHLWMRTADEGLAATLYAPNQLRTLIQGIPIRVDLTTDYPFDDKLTFTVSSASAVNFALHLRVPVWAENATIQVAGNDMREIMPGTFYKISREWHGTTEIVLRLPSQPQLEHRERSVSLIKEPLVYALKIDEDWRRIHQNEPYRELPHADWEVYPTTPWNYALHVDNDIIGDSFTFEKQSIGQQPFSPEGAPIKVRARAYRIPEWQARNGDAEEIPGTLDLDQLTPESITLIPYGCTNLRITQFPIGKASDTK